MKLNKQQRTLTGEILGNLAVVWFGGGIVAPLFAGQEGFLTSFVIGFSAFVFFYSLAILTLRS